MCEASQLLKVCAVPSVGSRIEYTLQDRFCLFGRTGKISPMRNHGIAPMPHEKKPVLRQAAAAAATRIRDRQTDRSL